MDPLNLLRLVAAPNQKNAIRFGHFYSARLIEKLGLPSDDGVVRVSMVHYNTLEEVERLTHALDSILPH